MSIYGTDEQRKVVSGMTDREKVIKGLECCVDYDYKCNNCPYQDDGGAEDGCYCDELKTDALALLKAHEQFLQWLVRLVTHEDGDGAECEIICRRLRDMGYVEKYEENGVEYWRAVKRNELD